MSDSSYICFAKAIFLLCYFFQTFHDGEDEGCGQETTDDQYAPKHPELHAAPKITDDGDSIVADCRSS